MAPQRSLGRLLLAVTLGVLAMGLFTPIGSRWWASAVIGWDAMATAFLAMKWSLILNADADETRLRSTADDPARNSVFVSMVAASVFSLFAATFVLRQIRALDATRATVWTVLTLAGIALAWTLTHTVYTLRYARLYYRNGVGRGFAFPPSDEPDEAREANETDVAPPPAGANTNAAAYRPTEMDFAYFSFTIGMCYQVSDVTVTSAECRSAVLVHSVLAFVFNTTILALALNLIFGFVS